MIQRYQFYIARQLTLSLLMIAFSLGGIVWLSQALRFLDFVIDQGVAVLDFLKLTLLLTPSLFSLILPPSLFAATAFTYYRLKADSELVVLQASGLSRWRLAQPAMAVALIAMCVNYILILFISPASYREFKEMQNLFRSSYASVLLQDGVFSTPVDGLTIFVRDRGKDGEMKGILVYDSRKPDESITMMAESGRIHASESGPKIDLMHGNRQSMQNGALSFLNYDEYTLDFNLYTQAMDDRATDARELGLTTLMENDPQSTPAENRKRLAEAHQRLTWPLYSFALVVVALAYLLGSEYNRRGSWKPILLAICTSTLLLFAAVGLRGAASMHSSLIYAMYAAVWLPILAGLYILKERALPMRRMLPA